MGSWKKRTFVCSILNVRETLNSDGCFNDLSKSVNIVELYLAKQYQLTGQMSDVYSKITTSSFLICYKWCGIF